MRARVFATVLLAIAPFAGAVAADDFKLIRLEQDVRNLERQVQVLSREVQTLSRQLGRSGERPPPPSEARDAEPSTTWIDARKWNRIRPGMDELEVIGILGPPTSMRKQDSMQVLLYALEIGSSGFLSGSVSLRERAVVAIEKPVLK
jgi:hypothetical protein